MNMRMGILLLGIFFLAGSINGEVFNGSFEKTTIKNPNSEEMQSLIKKQWKLKEPIVWPVGWSEVTAAPGHPVAVKFEVIKGDAHSGSNYIELSGKVGSRGIIWVDYSPLKPGGIYKASFFARGRGNAALVINLYSKEGKYLGAVGVVSARNLGREWRKYSGIFKNDRNAYLGKISLTSIGKCYFDDIDLVPVDFWEAEIVMELNKIAKKGMLLAPGSTVDEEKYKENIEAIKRMLPEIKKFINANPIPGNIKLLKKIEDTMPVITRGESATISVEMYNKTLAIRRICERLLKEVSFKDISE